MPIAAVLLALWAAGAAAFLLRLTYGAFRISRLVRKSVPVQDRGWLRLFDETRAQLGVARSVALLRSHEVDVPLACGIASPAVILPPDADGWPLERRRAVLRHELAHVERRDALTQVLADVACAALFWNPLAHAASRAMRAERERACDDRALACGERATDYADSLLALAQASRGGPMAALAMARRSQLEGRLVAVLDPTLSRAGATRRWAWIAAGAALIVAVPLAAVQAKPAAAEEDDAPPIPPRPPRAPRAPRPAVASAPAALPAPSARPTAAATPAPAAAPRASDQDDDQDEQEAPSPARGQRAPRPRAWSYSFDTATPPEPPEPPAPPEPPEAPEAPLAPEAPMAPLAPPAPIAPLAPPAPRAWQGQSGFTAMAAPRPPAPSARELPEPPRPPEAAEAPEAPEAPERGNTSVHRREDSHGQTWSMTWNDDSESGSLQVNGSLVFDADGNVTDLKGTSLDLLVRRGGEVRQVTMQNRGHGLERRMLVNGAEQPWNQDATRWLAGFFVEVDRRSGFAADWRFPALYEQGGAKAVLAEVALMTSDHARSRYLTRLIEREPKLAGRTLDGTLSAVQQMKSDYEKGRVLGAVAEHADLRDESLRQAFLGAAGQMKSDYEKGRVLQLVLRRKDLTPRLAGDALQVVAKMGSDYEKGRALTALAEKLPANLVDLYVGTVRSMKSDYEKARALVAVIDARQIPPATLEAIVAACAEVRSDYEAARVLVAVARRGPISDQLRSALVATAQRIRSQHERQRVLAAVQ